MAITLQKNQKISLKKKDREDGLHSIKVGLGWEPYMLEKRVITKSSGLFGLKKEKYEEMVRVNRNIDIDATVIAYDGTKPVAECSYRNRLIKQLGVELVKHSGDNTTGRGTAKQDDETIIVNLDNIIKSSKINKLYVVLNIYSPAIMFNQIEGAYVNVYDDNHNILATYKLSEENYNRSNGIVVGKIEKNSDNVFEFKALGDGVKTTGIDQLKKQALEF